MLRPIGWLFAIALLHVTFAVAAGLAQEEIKDVTFYFKGLSGEKTPILFYFNDQEIGTGAEGFAAIVDRVRELPADTSIVWGPNYDRCGACSGDEPSRAPKAVYPELWKELEGLVKERGLTLSSYYHYVGESPAPEAYVNPRQPRAGKQSSFSIAWSNFRGPKTPHEEVLYYLDGDYVGRGDEGFDRILEQARKFPVGAQVDIPRFELSGRAASENYSHEELAAQNAYLRNVYPFVDRRSEINTVFAERKLKAKFYFAPPGSSDDETVVAWWSGSRRGEKFLTFGRMVRHEQKPRAAAARLGWSHYDASERRKRKPESEAIYTVNDVDLGQGVAGFGKAMDQLTALPEGSVVHIRVCIRTQGPFTCALIYQGHRHFERTGFEPYCGMIPWLLDVASNRKLEVEWIPDEQISCGDCELNK